MTVQTTQSEEPPRTHPRRRPGAGFYVGLALLLTGAGLLGYVGWQFLGTNIASRQVHERVVADLREEWESGGTTGGEADAGRSGHPVVGEARALVRIPAFGDDYVVPVLEGVTDEVLASGFGHFPGTAQAGRVGNYALAAHRVTHGEPLRDMPQLRPGDEILVETRNAVHTYRLDTDPNDLVVTFHDVWVVDPLPTNPDGGVEPPSQEPGQRLITLTTCSELFHTDNRMIAFGHLVGTERK